MKKKLEKCIFGRAKFAFASLQGTSLQNVHTVPLSTWAAGAISLNNLDDIIFL